MRLIKEKTSIDFLGRKRRIIALGLSVFFVVVSFVSLATRGLEFGIDFTGGILLEVGYSEAANLESIRSDLIGEGYANVQVQRFGAENVILVRLPPQEGDVDQIRSRLQQTLQTSDGSMDLRRVEFVSPQVGSELAERGALAMVIALMMIFLYVMVRFQWKFSAGAVAALAHDAIVTVGFFSMFGLPFDLTVVAAVLAVIGYSLNEHSITIEVWDWFCTISRFKFGTGFAWKPVRRRGRGLPWPFWRFLVQGITQAIRSAVCCILQCFEREMSIALGGCFVFGRKFGFFSFAAFAWTCSSKGKCSKSHL